ncbi:hypothetical protein F4820DRAFT_239553 [Hypoxylon rubiginosum]|uniref:Uncharacterized protein n=1 Tax=Hypoxylon rubiginosum TaxID=110542 RepID=A0ACB9Z618_9PEZI|nr:hypothetical protein F4820DRAFT_239553 [Hypoxylon rubiginosum]
MLLGPRIFRLLISATNSPVRDSCRWPANSSSRTDLQERGACSSSSLRSACYPRGRARISCHSRNFSFCWSLQLVAASCCSRESYPPCRYICGAFVLRVLMKPSSRHHGSLLAYLLFDTNTRPLRPKHENQILGDGGHRSLGYTMAPEDECRRVLCMRCTKFQLLVVISHSPPYQVHYYSSHEPIKRQ